MNSKATCVHQHICVFFCLVCVCVCVRVHLGIHHSVSERHSCPVPSVSVVAGSGWLSRRQTGGGHTAATLIHTEHTLHRDDHTHTQSRSQSRIAQAHRYDSAKPPSHRQKRSHTLMPTHGGLAKGQRVRRVSMDESVEREPGRRWSSATHTASMSVPGSRAENKPGPTSSIWPAAPPDSQPGNSWLDQCWAPDFMVTNDPRQVQVTMCNFFCPEAAES